MQPKEKQMIVGSPTRSIKIVQLPQNKYIVKTEMYLANQILYPLSLFISFLDRVFPAVLDSH